MMKVLDPMNLMEYEALSEAERKVWADAYGISCVGAVNTAGVTRTMHEDIVVLRADYQQRHIEDAWRRVDRHPAIAAMTGHLYYLNGVALGPEEETLQAIERVQKLRERFEKGERG